MVMEVWHCFLDVEPDRSILTALSQAGLCPVKRDLSALNGPGIVFFNELSPHVFDLLRDASKRGAERVLAIPLSSPLRPAAVWSLLGAGASDVFAWNHSTDAAAEIAARFERWLELDEIVESSLVKDNLAGKSSLWTRVLRQVVEVAHFTNSSILITGESGTGKELFAQLVHSLDPRPRKGRLVVCDCTTIVPELSGSEFFGHERGAFTGAVTAREGAFALADGGTLFLDEVGELPLNLQAELLRVTQEHTYKRVGGNTWHKTNFRLVCATNLDLHEAQAQGKFRHDLFHRIAAWSCHLPPLRERPEDILVLVRHFIEELRPADPPELDDAVKQYFQSREYHGNVRDLKQLVTRIVQHHVGPGPITAGDIPEPERPCGECESVDWSGNGLEHAVRLALSSGVTLKEIERVAGEIAERIVVEEEAGNLQRAATRLGVTGRALQLRRAARRSNGSGAG